MDQTEGCRQTLEITVPAEEVEQETQRAVLAIQKQVRLPGFRPGKVPVSLIRTRFKEDVRKEVLESLIPKHFFKQAEDESLRVVGSPDVSEVHLHDGEPLRFKAEFEVAPEIELGEYKGITVTYQDPQITDEEVDKRIEAIREQKAEYVNLDPRPVVEGDYAVISLASVPKEGEDPINQDEVVVNVGGPDTLPAFSENLAGMSPDEEKEFDVSYPEDFGDEKLAGTTVRFHLTLKGIRRKELPELSDEFAQDLGDFQTMAELREKVRSSSLAEAQMMAQQKAKRELLNKLAQLHDFPVPETFIERQIEHSLEQQLRGLAAQGVDPRKLKLDWDALKSAQRDQAILDVKGALLLDKVAARESIEVTNDELDLEIQLLAKQEREPVAAVRMRLEKEGAVQRIAQNLRSEKTVSFLFEHARKVAED